MQDFKEKVAQVLSNCEICKQSIIGAECDCFEGSVGCQIRIWEAGQKEEECCGQ